MNRTPSRGDFDKFNSRDPERTDRGKREKKKRGKKYRRSKKRWISSLSSCLWNDNTFCFVRMFIRLIASFVRMSRSKWNREKFFPFFSIHFERFTLSLIVQLTSINRAENEKFGEIWLISQNTRIPSLEWYNFSFSLFFFSKKVLTECVRERNWKSKVTSDKNQQPCRRKRR